MEYRKIVKSGNTSYVVSIPRDWILKNKVEKGSIISIEENSENALVIRAGEQHEIKKEKSVSINLNEITPATLRREVVSCYINGYSTVEFFGKSAKEKAEAIKKEVEELIAFEIMEMSPKRIVVKDCLSVEQMSAESIVRKMDVTAREMIKEALTVLEAKEKKDANAISEGIDSIESMDKNMNRLVFLSSKIVREALENSLLAQKLKLSPLNILVQNIITTTLENLGDNVKNLARFASMPASVEELRFIKHQLAASLENYEDVIKAYFTADKQKSNNVSDVKHMLREKNEDFLKAKRSVGAVRMVERLQAIESFIGIISRTTIDMA